MAAGRRQQTSRPEEEFAIPAVDLRFLRVSDQKENAIKRGYDLACAIFIHGDCLTKIHWQIYDIQFLKNAAFRYP